MGNTSSLRSAMLKDDAASVKIILDEAGDGAPDLINEDFTSDCCCSRERNIQSPLHSAIGRGKDEIVELLLRYGADINQPGLWGQTGLHIAAKMNNVHLCRLAVEYGADLSAEDRDGRRAIHSASMFLFRNKTHVDALKYVLEEVGQPDDVHLCDVDGRTPLHDAARYGNTLAAKYLLERGARPAAKSANGKTPLDEARRNNKVDIVKMLMKYEK